MFVECRLCKIREEGLNEGESPTVGGSVSDFVVTIEKREEDRVIS